MLSGCAAPPKWDSEAPYPPPHAPQLGDILHTATGHYINRDALMAAVAHYPLVYIGEVHDNPASHRLQLEVLTALAAQRGAKVALATEMFNREQQPILDQWVAGELSEKEFVKQVRWFDNWGSDFEHYRALLMFCRDNRIPVVGLNVPKALGRKVSMTPLDALDEESRSQLPDMDMSDSYQRAMIETIFGAHGAGSAMVESFYRRQTLWDETMAASVSEYMGQHPQQQMVVVAGGWHVEYGFGIPRRVHRRLPLPYTVIGGDNLVIPEERRAQLMDVTMPRFPMRAVDYLVYQEYELFTPSGVQLGVLLDDSGDERGIAITDIVKGSNAERAGLLKGDRLVALDGEPLGDNFDLIYALKQKLYGTQALFIIIRDGVEQRLHIELAEPLAREHP